MNILITSAGQRVSLVRSFQKELSKQLFEKGSIGTGFKNFEELDFQIIIGMQDSEIRQVDNKMFAKIDFNSWFFLYSC